jgi:hypothetical protein
LEEDTKMSANIMVLILEACIFVVNQNQVFEAGF